MEILRVLAIWIGLIVLALVWMGAASALGWLTDHVHAKWADEQALKERKEG